MQIKSIKTQIQSTEEQGNNQFGYKFLKCIQDFKNVLENINFEIEKILKHPNYITLKQEYEKQAEICHNLKQEIERKKNELNQEYPDLNDIEKYPTIASKLNFLFQKFPDKIYQTHFIITCRTASLDFNFTNFTEVEIADFNEQQIKTFVHKWFNPKDKSYPSDPIKEARFLEQLFLNPAIQELANSPLLLTLLCLVFRDDGSFPKNRSDLYENGLNILLKKWDIERNIYRDEIYRNLTNERKQDLLSQVAFITFNRKDYFFKQKEVEDHISTYIRNLPGSQTDPDALRIDSEAVLKSIEAQHGLLIERARGIYSFSHLTFQEYFTARKIVNTSNPKNLEQSLRELASHIREKRWREVFLLAVGLLSQADFLIENMKEQVDLIAAEDRQIQELLTWSHNRALHGYSSDQLTSIRIYYLILASQFMKMPPINTISHFLDNLITTLNSHSDVQLIRQSFKLDTKLFQAYYSSRNRRFNPEFARIIAQTDNHILKFHFNDQWLNLLKKMIPHPDNQSQFDAWWKSDGKLWTEQLNNFFTQQPKTIPNFDLTSEQLDLLRQYFTANEFLLECMNTNCMIDREIRQKIEDTLFLPSHEMDILIG